MIGLGGVPRGPVRIAWEPPAERVTSGTRFSQALHVLDSDKSGTTRDQRNAARRDVAAFLKDNGHWAAVAPPRLF
jgi:hypothetical protein